MADSTLFQSFPLEFSNFYNANLPLSDEWFRRSTPYSLENTGTDIAALLVSSPQITTPGQNQGLNNFVPLGLDIGAVSPSSATCFLAEALFDEAPGTLTPALINSYTIVQAFLNGAVAPFFAPFNCPVTEYAKPGPNAGKTVVTTAGKSTTCNVLVNGKYQC